jgi:hypothetical protein
MHLDLDFIKIGRLQQILGNRRIFTEEADIPGLLYYSDFSKIGSSRPILIKFGSKCINFLP